MERHNQPYVLKNFWGIASALSANAILNLNPIEFDKSRENKDHNSDVHYIDEDGYLITKIFEPDHIYIEREDEHFYYKINKNGFRSQHFRLLEKSELNILYSGCSNTLGQGLPDRLQWTTLLSEKIQGAFPNIKVESFNVAHVGHSIQVSIKNIMGFIREHGKPDFIFLLLPDMGRALKYHTVLQQYARFHYSLISATDNDPLIRKYVKEYVQEDNLLIAVELLRMLEDYCEAADINLFWGTWFQKDEEIYKRMTFKNYFSLPEGEKRLKPLRQKENPLILPENTDNLPYWESARDDGHYGSCWTTYTASEIFKKVQERCL